MVLPFLGHVAGLGISLSESGSTLLRVADNPPGAAGHLLERRILGDSETERFCLATSSDGLRH